MRLGNAAWGLRETPLEEQLRITSAMGLDLLELSIAGYERDFLQLTASEAEINEVKTLFHRYRVRLECGCTGNDFTGDDVAGQVKKVRKVIEIAAALGISRLRIFAGFRSDSEIFGARSTGDRRADRSRRLRPELQRQSGGGNPRRGCDQRKRANTLRQRHNPGRLLARPVENRRDDQLRPGKLRGGGGNRSGRVLRPIPGLGSLCTPQGLPRRPGGVVPAAWAKDGSSAEAAAGSPPMTAGADRIRLPGESRRSSPQPPFRNNKPKGHPMIGRM